MSNTITRRAALTGTAAGAAAIVAGTGPALANTDHDRAEWLALLTEYAQIQAQLNAAIDARERAEEQAGSESPQPPMHLCILDANGAPLVNVWGIHACKSEAEIRTHRQWQIDHCGPRVGSGAAEALRDDLAARAQWEAECESLRERYHVNELGEVERAAYWRSDALAREIANKPAISVVGIAVKLAIWKMEDTTVADTLEDADWHHWAGLSAMHDAMRLTGLPAETATKEVSA